MKSLFKKEINIIMVDEGTQVHRVHDLSFRRWFIMFICFITILLFIGMYDIIGITKVNLYEITYEQLIVMDDIGPVRARLILNFLSEYEPMFYEEMLSVDGIGEETIDVLRKYTTIPYRVYGRW